MKSQFEEYVEEDCKQFEEVCKYYKNKTPEDIDTLYNLTTECLMLSQRWSDIASNSSLYAKKYRTLQEMHVDCRVFYGDAKDDLKNFGRVD